MKTRGCPTFGATSSWLVNVEMVQEPTSEPLEEPGLRGAWRTSQGPDTTEEVPNAPHQALRSREGYHTAGSCGSCGYHRLPAADWPASGQRQCNLQAGQLNTTTKLEVWVGKLELPSTHC